VFLLVSNLFAESHIWRIVKKGSVLIYLVQNLNQYYYDELIDISYILPLISAYIIVLPQNIS